MIIKKIKLIRAKRKAIINAIMRELNPMIKSIVKKAKPLIRKAIEDAIEAEVKKLSRG